MYKILTKKILNPTVTLMEVDAPMIAKKAEPGQFIILRVDAEGERIPLTIADFDREKQIHSAACMQRSALGQGLGCGFIISLGSLVPHANCFFYGVAPHYSSAADDVEAAYHPFSVIVLVNYRCNSQSAPTAFKSYFHLY